MKKRTILYYCLPAIAMVVATLTGIVVEGRLSSRWELLTVPAGAFVFYALPLALWLYVCVALRPGAIYWHLGFVAANLALISMILLSFLHGDPSGLPMHWVLYWPLAVILQILFGIAAKLTIRLLPNKGFNTDAGKTGAG